MRDFVIIEYQIQEDSLSPVNAYGEPSDQDSAALLLYGAVSSSIPQSEYYSSLAIKAHSSEFTPAFVGEGGIYLNNLLLIAEGESSIEYDGKKWVVEHLPSLIETANPDIIQLLAIKSWL